MSIHIEVVDDDHWADRVTQKWLAIMEEHPAVRLCLPTGETPRPVYEHIAQAGDFTRSTVFLLDEFDLPPGNPARCDEMIRRDFLNLLSHPPAAFHAFDTETEDLAKECRRYESLVDDGGLDLTLLGLGGNGHLGLNEPGSALGSPTRVVDLARSTTIAAARYGANARPERGVTLGLRPIFDSGEIWLLVSGPDKAAILEAAMNSPISADVPASLLRNHANVTVLADRSAASALNR